MADLPGGICPNHLRRGAGHHTRKRVPGSCVARVGTAPTLLGLTPGRTPVQSTVQRLFARLDADALVAALSGQFHPSAAPDPAVRGGQGVVLAQEPIDWGVDKAEAELTIAPALLTRMDWRGRVLTGDALFCQCRLCRHVLAHKPWRRRAWRLRLLGGLAIIAPLAGARSSVG